MCAPARASSAQAAQELGFDDDVQETRPAPPKREAPPDLDQSVMEFEDDASEDSEAGAYSRSLFSST
jgi:hypothetical protein